jgi:hypothetical protein
VGVWTFNEELQTGQFPLQTLSPQNSVSVARRLSEFLKAQPHGGGGDLEKAIPAVLELARSSDYITVIIISSGSADIRGTPYDAEINASFRLWRREQARGQMPFLTLLRASDGTIRHHAVNTPPFPLEMPPLPEALVRARADAMKAAAEAAKAPPKSTVPPLIVSGKKPEPRATQTVADAAPPILKIIEVYPTNPPAPPVVATVTNVEPGPAAHTSALSVVALPASVPEPAARAAATMEVETPPGVTPVAARTTRPEATQATVPASANQPMRKALLAGLALTVALIGVVLIILLRGRHAKQQASLITRSFDNRRR